MNKFVISAAALPLLLGMVVGCGGSDSADSTDATEQASDGSDNASTSSGLAPASELQEPTEGFGVRAEVVAVNVLTDEVTGRSLQAKVRLSLAGDSTSGARVYEVRLACGDDLVEGSIAYVAGTGEEYPTGPITIGAEPIEIESPAESVDPEDLAPECGEDLAEAWMVVVLDDGARSEDAPEFNASEAGDGAVWEDGDVYGVLPVAIDVAAEVSS